MSSAGDLFAGGGRTGELMARLDWAGTPVGPVERWPQSLRAAVRLVLSSRYPMLVLWGPQYTQLYNDAYSALIGDKHPAALGGDVRVTLAEGWDVLRPIIEEAVRSGVASWVPALLLRLHRAGYSEEAYFSVSHAAARDDAGRTVGVFAVCSEVTDQVVGERRLRLLRDLSLRVEHTRAVDATCAELLTAVAGHQLDVPFAAVYLRDGGVLRRLACVGAQDDGSAVDAVLPAAVALDVATPVDRWGMCRAAGGQLATVADLAGELSVPGGAWGDPVATALALPLPSADRSQPLGVLLAGVSPSRALDESYRSFFELLAQQVSVALRNARAYEEERQRAEALAELDRAKTEFFTNVSHEFRTPLTLMLGPLADALADSDAPLPARQRERVDTAWRNANRLLKLVNSLLMFASLEAGRADRDPRPVDLARYTGEIASVFRAAVERAGLRLVVDCPPLPEVVSVDPGHWETIVGNLLSNALKFTFVGEVRVALRADETAVRLTVSDTGIGIAADELARLFERFHRVQGARARTHEGTGIGLALVQELARLHGGTVDVVSEVGAGTTFTVELPWTGVRVTVDPQAAADGAGVRAAEAQAAEAMGWLVDPPSAAVAGRSPVTAPEPTGTPAGTAAAAGVFVLVADDNADMRGYLTRLLSRQGWQVESVGDGQAALEAVRRRPPDLLLTDVMMPRLDGFGLLRELRRDPATRSLPVVVLSARAGQEAGAEGLELGADDYVVKPFSAADLLARLRGAIARSRARTAAPDRAPGQVDAAAWIRGGRAVESAVLLLTGQARAAVAAAQAVTAIGDVPVAVPPEGPTGREGPELIVPVPVTQGPPATLTLRWARGHRPGSDVEDRLIPVARMLGAVVRGVREAHPGTGGVGAALRDALLPDRLPEPDGWQVAARYLPADAPAAVGGDWYDVHPLPDRRVVLCVGEVAGTGVAAVTLAGHLRHALRSSAGRGDAPGRALLATGALLRRLDPTAVVTAFLGYLDLGTGALQWCGTGYPAPLYREPGQPARRLPGTGPGTLGELTTEPSTRHTVLSPGAWLLLHTAGLASPAGGDGPVEGASPAGGPGRSSDPVAAAGCRAGTVREVVDAVLAEAQGRRGGDIVVLGVGRDLPAPPRAAAPVTDADRAWTYPADPHAAAAMRRDLRRCLAASGVDEDVAFELLAAVSEAVNNAVEHAQRPSRPEVAVRVSLSAGVARIEVRDYGSWRGRPPAMDRGRGAALMSAYADVRVISKESGTTVLIERSVGVEG